jgi:MFS family permease
MVARSMLGLAEAGFYPGLVLYFSYWFPAAAASFAWINSIGNLGGSSALPLSVGQGPHR